MYAQDGSFFVIPPPHWFNEESADRRADFRARQGLRYVQNLNRPGGPGTKPYDTGAYPFAGEPLNVEIDVHGALTEDMPADPASRAAWTQRLWMRVPEAGTQERNTFDQETPGYRPRLRFF